MDVVKLVEQLLAKLLEKSQMPAWVVKLVLELVKKYLTPELVAWAKAEVAKFLCDEIRQLAKATDNGFDDHVAELVCKALSGECKA